VVVGSGDFPESAILGQIYADALEAKGIPVATEFCISSREIYYPLMISGQITVMPEYNGALLTTSVDQGSNAVTEPQVDAALQKDLPHSLMILDPSAAYDSDTVTVTQATAVKYHLRSIADLSRIPGGLVIGGPSEFQSREQGTLGLKAKYKLIPDFVPLDDSGPGTIQALTDGQVQAADVFSTDPLIPADHLKVLTDPQHVFTAENIVPLVYKPAVNPLVTSLLNDVSARLTSADLSQLDTDVEIDGNSIAAVARNWLSQAGLP
jgi:osmoprotectant transport system substrate-binding protein